VGLLSDWHYRSLCIEIASRGYRGHEPHEAQRETSQVLAKVFAALREESMSKGSIADELCVSAEEIEQLVFGLALTGLTSTSGANGTTSRERPQLHVVRSPNWDE